MIISNTSTNPDVNRRSILSLGDTLAARGDIYAAHFCYILAQVEFGSYGSNNVKIVLIGATHNKPYSEFISTEAIMLTEIYEYARKLSEPFSLIELQTFKFDLAIKMVDCGLIEKALLYIEQVANNIVNEPEKYKQSFINNVYVLGDRLKYHDPVCKDSDEDATSLSWLNKLADIVGKYEKGEIVQENNNNNNNQALNSCTPDGIIETTEIKQPQQQNKWNSNQNDYDTSTMMGRTVVDSHMAWQPKPPSSTLQEPYDITLETQYNNESVNDSQQQQYQSYQQDYWSNQQQQQQNNYDRQDYSMPYTTNQQSESENVEQNNWAYEV